MIRRIVVCDVCKAEAPREVGSFSLDVQRRGATRATKTKVRRDGMRRRVHRAAWSYAQIDVCKECASTPVSLAVLFKSATSADAADDGDER